MIRDFERRSKKIFRLAAYIPPAYMTFDLSLPKSAKIVGGRGSAPWPYPAEELTSHDAPYRL